MFSVLSKLCLRINKLAKDDWEEMVERKICYLVLPNGIFPKILSSWPLDRRNNQSQWDRLAIGYVAQFEEDEMSIRTVSSL